MLPGHHQGPTTSAADAPATAASAEASGWIAIVSSSVRIHAYWNPCWQLPALLCWNTSCKSRHGVLLPRASGSKVRPFLIASSTGFKPSPADMFHMFGACRNKLNACCKSECRSSWKNCKGPGQLLQLMLNCRLWFLHTRNYDSMMNFCLRCLGSWYQQKGLDDVGWLYGQKRASFFLLCKCWKLLFWEQRSCNQNMHCHFPKRRVRCYSLHLVSLRLR